jgi:hypothetical protein
MKAAVLCWIACVSLTIGACSSPGKTGPGASSSPAESVREKAADALSAAAAAVKPRREVEVAPGTVLTVRTTRALSTVRDRARDTFTATLDEPILVNDTEALPRGTRFTGHITQSEESGRLEGHAALAITLDSFDMNGDTHPVTTSVNTRATEGHKKRNITAVGGGAGVGALIGGIAGGGKGAAIGAAVGAGAGTGAAAATGKQHVEIPAETRFRFTLKNAVTVAE